MRCAFGLSSDRFIPLGGDFSLYLSIIWSTTPLRIGGPIASFSHLFLAVCVRSLLIRAATVKYVPDLPRPKAMCTHNYLCDWRHSRVSIRLSKMRYLFSSITAGSYDMPFRSRWDPSLMRNLFYDSFASISFNSGRCIRLPLFMQCMPREAVL